MRTLSILLFGLFVAGCATNKVTPKTEGTPVPAPTSAVVKPTETPAAAPKKDLSSNLEMRCTLEKDERVLTVVPNASGCKVVYSKFGNATEVAQAVNGTQYCDQVRMKIQNNLEAAGFLCK